LPGAPTMREYEKRTDHTSGSFEPSRKSAFQLSATNLGKHRAWLYKSAGFAPKKPCNLIVFLDGSGHFHLIDSVTLLHTLIADRKLDQAIAIYTDSPDRDRDLACSDRYLEFLVSELIPWVAKHYDVQFGPARTIINGASLGGLFAGYAVLKRPDVFAGALMQSPTLWWHPAGEHPEWLIRQFEKTGNARGRFFVSPGIFERTAADPEAEGILHCSRRFAEHLAARHVPAVL